MGWLLVPERVANARPGRQNHAEKPAKAHSVDTGHGVLVHSALGDGGPHTGPGQDAGSGRG